MMSIIAFLTGIMMTTVIGWLTVRLSEGTVPVLGRLERLAYGSILGPTLGMFLVFLFHIAGLTRLDLTGFLAPLLIATTILGVAVWKCGGFRSADIRPFVPAKAYPRWMTTVVLLLCVWTTVKILAGAFDLTSVPTYWDDSFNNWNMRGKMFFITEKLTLEIPAGNGVQTTAEGVGSYPVTVPMMKTWVSVLRGQWHEGLVNSVHLLWFLGLLSVLYFTLRRYVDSILSALGIWACASFPLVIIHGTNPYADMLVAAHVLCAISALLGISKAANTKDSATWIRMFFLSLGLLILTKNESLILHIPLLLLTAAASVLRSKNIEGPAEQRKSIVIGCAIFIAFAVPWILFKWRHGLTFGNAKSISGLSLAFNSGVLKAIWIHLTHQPNWLLLPLVLPLAITTSGKKFWSSPETLLGIFVLSEIIVQFSIFLFVPSLGTEAIHQTGLSRGLLQIAPEMMLLLFFALRYAAKENSVQPSAAAAADNSASSAVMFA